MSEIRFVHGPPGLVLNAAPLRFHLIVMSIIEIQIKTMERQMHEAYMAMTGDGSLLVYARDHEVLALMQTGLEFHLQINNWIVLQKPVESWKTRSNGLHCSKEHLIWFVKEEIDETTGSHTDTDVLPSTNHVESLLTHLPETEHSFVSGPYIETWIPQLDQREDTKILLASETDMKRLAKLRTLYEPDR